MGMLTVPDSVLRATRRICAASALTTVLLCAPPSNGDSGVGIHGEIGHGYALGFFTHQSAVSPPPGVTGGGRRFETNPTSVAHTVTLVPFYALSPHVGLGVGAHGGIHPFVDDERFGATTLSIALLTGASAWMLWRPKGEGLLVSASAGFDRSAFAGGQNEIGGSVDGYDFQPLWGPRFRLGGGWLWPQHVGLGGSFTLSVLSDERTTYRQLTADVNFLFSSW